jgi:uncharacterized iron-regulated protein
MLTSCVNGRDSNHSEKLVLQDHPLANKIWDVKQNAFIEKADLLVQLSMSRYLLLGESHDNISHHQHQADIISSLFLAKKNASVHFEMIDDHQVKQFDLDQTQSTDQLIDALNAQQSGWDYQHMYRIIFEQTLKAGYDLHAANLSHKTIRKIFKDGEESIPVDVRQLMTQVTLTNSQRQSLEEEIVVGHCNVIHEAMITPMVLTQRVRDSRMALSLLSSDADVRVLIAGSGHARNDRGVPLYLHTRDKFNKVVSVGFIEVAEGDEQVTDYYQRWDAESLPFDYVWFTPRFDRKDPCEGLEERLSRNRQDQANNN